MSTAVQVDTHAERYPLVAGVAIWRFPLLGGLLLAGGLSLGVWELAALSALGAILATHLDRSQVIEVSPAGLCRGFLLGGRFVARGPVLAWPAIAEIQTSWRAPDRAALETVVRDRHRSALRLSSAMGLRAYWTLLAEIARRAPAAARTELTPDVLAQGPPGQPFPPRAALVAGALALAILVSTLLA